MPRIYLDNAATSYPKPEAVYRAVERYQRELGTAVGRGATRIAGEVQQVVDQCRLRAARLFGANSPQQVLFTFSGTDSLNLVLQGGLSPGERVVTTVWEHNSVLRPLRALEMERQLSVEIISHDSRGRVDQDALRQALKQPTRLVVVTHASNVTGIVQPVEEIARIAHQAGALVLLDAAQTAGHLPVNLNQLPVDFIACPGHKGLMGPLGTGLLVMRAGMESELRPLRFGGTGTTSESDRQPETSPERFEAGNHNAPGLFGLAAALEWQQSHPPGESGQQPILQLLRGLQSLPGLRVHLDDETLPRAGLVSISFDRIPPDVAAGILDEHFQIETRAGLHCAPLAHGALGTLAEGGTVRLSVGPFTTTDEIDLTLEAIAQIAVAV